MTISYVVATTRAINIPKFHVKRKSQVSRETPALEEPRPRAVASGLPRRRGCGGHWGRRPARVQLGPARLAALDPAFGAPPSRGSATRGRAGRAAGRMTPAPRAA